MFFIIQTVKEYDTTHRILRACATKEQAQKELDDIKASRWYSKDATYTLVGEVA